MTKKLTIQIKTTKYRNITFILTLTNCLRNCYSFFDENTYTHLEY